MKDSIAVTKEGLILLDYLTYKTAARGRLSKTTTKQTQQLGMTPDAIDGGLSPQEKAFLKSLFRDPRYGLILKENHGTAQDLENLLKKISSGEVSIPTQGAGFSSASPRKIVEGLVILDSLTYKEHSRGKLSNDTQAETRNLGMIPDAIKVGGGLTASVKTTLKNLIKLGVLKDSSSDQDLEAILKNEAMIRSQLCKVDSSECSGASSADEKVDPLALQPVPPRVPKEVEAELKKVDKLRREITVKVNRHFTRIKQQAARFKHQSEAYQLYFTAVTLQEDFHRVFDNREPDKTIDFEKAKGISREALVQLIKTSETPVLAVINRNYNAYITEGNKCKNLSDAKSLTSKIVLFNAAINALLIKKRNLPSSIERRVKAMAKTRSDRRKLSLLKEVLPEINTLSDNKMQQLALVSLQSVLPEINKMKTDPRIHAMSQELVALPSIEILPELKQALLNYIEEYKNAEFYVSIAAWTKNKLSPTEVKDLLASLFNKDSFKIIFEAFNEISFTKSCPVCRKNIVQELAAFAEEFSSDKAKLQSIGRALRQYRDLKEELKSLETGSKEDKTFTNEKVLLLGILDSGLIGKTIPYLLGFFNEQKGLDTLRGSLSDLIRDKFRRSTFIKMIVDVLKEKNGAKLVKAINDPQTVEVDIHVGLSNFEIPKDILSAEKKDVVKLDISTDESSGSSSGNTKKFLEAAEKIHPRLKAIVLQSVPINGSITIEIRFLANEAKEVEKKKFLGIKLFIDKSKNISAKQLAKIQKQLNELDLSDIKIDPKLFFFKVKSPGGMVSIHNKYRFSVRLGFTREK